MSFAPEALTRDGFLGGRLHVWQPRTGFRSGSDAVLLAAAVPARPGQAVLELGAGAGVAILCLGARVPGLALTAVEVQPAYADLARLNAAEAGQALEVVAADLADLPAEVTARSFDHVLMNPPFFRHGARSPAPDPGRETARAGPAAAADWIRTGLRRLRPDGTLTLIQAAARLPELMAALPATGVTVRPLAGRPDRPADRVLIWAVKGSRAGFRLLPPMVLHPAAGHREDAGAYAPWAQSVLRDGAPLPAD